MAAGLSSAARPHNIPRSWAGDVIVSPLVAWIAVLIGGIAAVYAQPDSRLFRRWDFEKGQDNTVPSGFSFPRTGGGRTGQWILKAAADAPSGTRVLAQVDPDATDDRFPMAIADEPHLTDLRLSVKCKPVSGQVDQACGLVLRFLDEHHYYITRANALEQNVRFYKVVGGQRQQLASWRGPVAGGVWHQLQVEAAGDHFVISWDGQRVMEVVDRTFPEAGKVGMWTKADSVTSFDDLKVEPLGPLSR